MEPFGRGSGQGPAVVISGGSAGGNVSTAPSGIGLRVQSGTNVSPSSPTLAFSRGSFTMSFLPLSFASRAADAVAGLVMGGAMCLF